MTESSRPLRIEDYALIGDCETAALVGKNGSIDWLCVPRFDSPACFAALLGDSDNGRWLLAPSGGFRRTQRRYRDGTLILETEFETNRGSVKIIDFMPIRTESVDIVRIVEGLGGQVEMSMDLVIRFGYGSVVPWVRRVSDGILAVAGPDALLLKSPAMVHGENFHTVSTFTVSAGQSVPFILTWYPSHQPLPGGRDPMHSLLVTEQWWRNWSDRCSYQGRWKDVVIRSAITLKALTYTPTGGLIAAPTTSLPESPGGIRNWDYRYCWLRDATFTLYSLMTCGYTEEAGAWRDWLLRAVAGNPSQMQIMYGLFGERGLTEFEIEDLPGYEGSRPVRVGNAAHHQFQLDVFGEVMDALHVARSNGLAPDGNAWAFQKELMACLETVWNEPDEGIWEVRGPRRHFTHSKVMAWVAFDRAVKAVEKFGLDGPIEGWRRLRDTIHQQICDLGFDRNMNSFVQYYGAQEVDASLLMIPLVGFLPADDPRMQGTVKAVQDRLTHNEFITRYGVSPEVDGLSGKEGAFLLCVLWLADNLALQGRMEEARALFERVLVVRNDVGLLSEQYEPSTRRFLGNFPQAFSHVGLINTARNLDRAGGPGEDRPGAK
jgi:GH15 family glucan-1,4-alpha-glucosidase